MPKEGKIELNSSLIKHLKKEHCPQKVYVLFVSKSVRSVPTEAMTKGLYFETQCLGGDVRGEKVELPLLKSGKKSADNLRIDQQVDAFKEVCKDNQIVINQDDKSLKLEMDYNALIYLHGTIDFTASIFDDTLGLVPKAIVDLKLTGSLHNKFGDWSWFYPANMDHTQAVLYTHLWQKIHNEELPFYYMVFDYKAGVDGPESKIFRKEIKGLDMAELEESIRSAAEKLQFHESNNWNTNPSADNCKDCPLRGQCADVIKSRPINII